MTKYTEEENKHQFTEEMERAWREDCDRVTREYFRDKVFWETKRIDGKDVSTGVRLYPCDSEGQRYDKISDDPVTNR